MIICGKCHDDGRAIEGRQYLLHVQAQDTGVNYKHAVPVTFRADLCDDHAYDFLMELHKLLGRYIPNAGDALADNLPSVPTGNKPTPAHTKGKKK